MNQCETCGKLIDASEGETQCLACRKGTAASPLKVSDGEPDGSTNGDQEVESAAQAEQALYRDALCIRCRKHNALVESEFCLSCQLELLSLLGDAADDVAKEPPPPPKPPVASAVSLMNELDEKRDRTATSRIRVVGASKLK